MVRMKIESPFLTRARRAALGLMITALFASGAAGAGPDDAAVLAAQKDRLQAMVKNDLEALGRMLPDDFTYTHASGVADTKASLLASLKAGRLKYKSIDPGQPLVRVYGNTGILTGTATVQVDSATIGPAPFQILYTDVYVKKADGRWQPVAWQSTRPPAPASPAP
jgi:ketosteroid isomerase-like protein